MVKILVIEDDDSIRQAIIDTLEFADYEVAAAPDGVIGVKTAKEFMPDLILCDVMMPNLDGYGVLLALNELPRTARIPFIFLTAKATREDMRHGMVMGADDYITKPFTATELLETVEARLKRHAELDYYHTRELESIKQYINLSLPHEMRTPITGIMGYLYMLDADLENMDNDTIRVMVNSAQNSANRLNNLIENYVAYSQLKLVRNDKPLLEKLHAASTLDDFNTFIAGVAAKQASGFNRLDDLIVEADPASVFMFFDHADKLISVITNNAFKFSQTGTPIRIIGQHQGDYYVVSISNEGRGMTAEQISMIGENQQFERNTHEQQGAGLGLVIAENIVNLYEAAMTIESEPGKSTTVHIHFRLA